MLDLGKRTPDVRQGNYSRESQRESCAVRGMDYPNAVGTIHITVGPMHQSSMDKMRNFRLDYLGGREHEKLTIYDLGSQDVNGTYKEIFNELEWRYIGLDMEAGPNVDIVLRDPYRWKEVASNSGDLLVSGQAFEHIKYFWITMFEIKRILKPGGMCCIVAPSGGHEHRYPVDCWRFYPDGLQALADFSGFSVKKVFTQWEPDPRYGLESNEWSDSVLICEKPRPKSGPGIKTTIKDFVIKQFLLSQLPK